MAELRIQLANPTRTPGEVGDVVPDGWEWTLRDRLWFPIIRCTELSVEDGTRIYLADGVPEEVMAAHKETIAVHLRNEATLGMKLKAPAKLDRSLYPVRAVTIDLSLVVPRETEDAIRDAWRRRDLVKVAVKTAAHDSVVAAIEEKLGRKMKVEETALTSMDWLKKLMFREELEKAAGAPKEIIDSTLALKDAIVAASVAARDEIEVPEMGKVAIPPIIELSLKELEAATVKA